MVKYVAVCVSGLPRNLENSYFWLQNSILSVFLKNNIHFDVFCSFWNSDKFPADVDYITNLYLPVKLEIEEWNNDKIKELGWPKFKKMSLGTLPNFIGMFYKIFRCNELTKMFEKENNIKYDIIIRARTELKFLHTLDISELNFISDNPDKKKLFLKLIPNVLNIWTRDTFAFGNRNTMDVYCSLWNNLLDLNNKFRCSTPEILLQKWLELNNIECYNTSLDHNIVRN